MVSNGATLAAEMLAMIPNPAARFGAVIMGGSVALLETFKAEEQARQQAYGLLGQELSATTLAYQTQTKAGMAYSDGMTGLRDVAGELRLNMGEVTNVVTKNKEQMIQNGTQIKDINYGKTYVVTSVTEKRINLDQPGSYSTSSTGRSSSKFFVGHARFNEYVNSGNWVIIE